MKIGSEKGAFLVVYKRRKKEVKIGATRKVASKQKFGKVNVRRCVQKNRVRVLVNGVKRGNLGFWLKILQVRFGCFFKCL